jgi:hypothetical protein
MRHSLRFAACLFIALGCSSRSLTNAAPDGATGAVVPDAMAGPLALDASPAPDAALAPDAAPAPDAALAPDEAPAPDTAVWAPDLAPTVDGPVALPEPDAGAGIVDALQGPPDLKLAFDQWQIRFEALPTPPDAPPVSTDARLLVPGRARLVGTHFTVCSNATPASGNGDRWCAFTLPNKQIGLTDLWVIDVTKALAGTTITCDGTDQNCKLMIPPGGDVAQGTQLWTGQPMSGPIHPTTHRFDGDTLIFHALAPDNQDQYSGPIFAWRPGWDAPKQISAGKTAYSCSGHLTAEVFVCIENLTTTQPLEFDLTAGQLGTGTKTVKHVVPFRPGSQSSQWRAALSRDGQYLAFSAGGSALTDRETLYVSRFDSLGNTTTLKVGASRWSISADGTKVYFLANYNYDTMGAPAGTLTMMDFPSGGNEKTLAANVGAVQVLSDGGQVDRGVAFFDNVIAGKATYKFMRDRNVPSQVTTVVTNIGGVLAVSRDLRFVYFYKDFDMNNGTTTDGYVVPSDGTQTVCTLTTTLESDRFGTPFTENGSMILWADNVDQIDGVGEGWMANPAGCTGRQKWADGVDYWFPRANDGMVFSDKAVLDYATLEAMTFPGGNSLGPAITLQPQVSRVYAVLPDFKALLFTVVNSPASSDGIYLYSKLPF